MFSVNEILDLAIRIEKNGENTYRRAMDEINESELTTLLEWMADEEVKHADFFSNLKLELGQMLNVLPFDDCSALRKYLRFKSVQGDHLKGLSTLQ